jgi:Archaeal holliday junction resolvase (hjc)
VTPPKGAAPDAAATAIEGRGVTARWNGRTSKPNFTRPQARRGGRRSRDKGKRAERALVKFLQERGFAAERVPLSGSAGGRYCGDMTVPLLGIDRIVEVKVRARGFRELYSWLSGRDFLIGRADRLEPLVVLPLRLATDIAVAAERKAVTP